MYFWGNAFVTAPYSAMRILSVILLLVLLLSSCDEPLPPQAEMDVFPSVGDSTILFELNASESSDERTYAVALQYRWDFDNDLVWETKYSYEPIYVRHFPVPGTYHIRVEVINPDGLTSVANDSIIVFGRNQDVSILTDPRDGQSYTIVKLLDRWWMSESLRYGTIIDPLNQVMSDNKMVERIDTDPIDKMLYCNMGIASYWSSDHRLSESDIFQASHQNFYQEGSIVFAFVDRSYLEGYEKKQLLNSVRCIKNQD